MALHVPREQLLKADGGDVEFEYDHSVYWPTFVQFAASRRADYVARWERGGKRLGEYEGYLRGGSDKSLAELDQAEQTAAPDSVEKAVIPAVES